MRPGRPPMRPWVRPVPPPHWRPSYTGSLIGNILGLTFGVAIGSALDNLYYSGYSIDGYMNNQVYLTGVNQFNSYWPDATLYFGNGGLTSVLPLSLMVSIPLFSAMNRHPREGNR